MSWTVTIAGQPISTNHLWKRAWRTDRRGRRFMGQVLTDEAQDYKDRAIPVIRVARPSRWMPIGQIRVTYRLFLARMIDSDNCLKLLGDCIEAATGINDEVHLPCVQIKQIVPAREARVEIEIEEVTGA
jgi:Holliday junction resolvase RusA-like endonuclease